MKKKKINKKIIYYLVFILSSLLIILCGVFSIKNYHPFRNYQIAKEYYSLYNDGTSFNKFVNSLNNEFKALTKNEKEEKTKEAKEFLEKYPTFQYFKESNPTLSNQELSEYKYYQFNYFYELDQNIFIVNISLFSLGILIISLNSYLFIKHQLKQKDKKYKKKSKK